MPVVRAAFQPLAERSGDLAAQLGRGRTGIGDDQKVVQIGAVSLDVGKQALHQHLRLARAGGCGDQQAASPALHRGKLLLCQRFTHAPAPPLPSAFRPGHSRTLRS